MPLSWLVSTPEVIWDPHVQFRPKRGRRRIEVHGGVLVEDGLAADVDVCVLHLRASISIHPRVVRVELLRGMSDARGLCPWGVEAVAAPYGDTYTLPLLILAGQPLGCSQVLQDTVRSSTRLLAVMAKASWLARIRDNSRSEPREIFNWYLFLCTAIWAFSGVAKGFDEGISPTERQILDTADRSKQATSPQPW